MFEPCRFQVIKTRACPGIDGLTDLSALAGEQAVTVHSISLDRVDLDKLVSRINAGRESVSLSLCWKQHGKRQE